MLDLDSWSELFSLHYKSFGVLHFIDGTSSSTNQTNDEWGKLDSLVKLWIFGTISRPILQRVLKKNMSAHDVWTMLKDVFHDNKSAKAMQLDNDLCNIKLKNLTITEYFHKINRLADLLANIDAPMDKKNLVVYAINGLGDKYEQVEGIIHHRETPPTFAQTQSMLLLEESHLARKSTHQSARDPTSSLPHVLLAATSNNHKNSAGVPLCRNFQRGSCSFSERYNPSGLPTYTTGPLYGTWGPHVVYDPYVDQATTLPQAFNAMMVQDYGDSGWYMDTEETSHLAWTQFFCEGSLDPSPAPSM
ncbi:hybrid signal transduction histidine kinase M [Tanacetum coccineum]